MGSWLLSVKFAVTSLLLVVLQGSATSIRTPSLNRAATFQPTAGGRGRLRSHIITSAGLGSEAPSRRHSVEALGSEDGLPHFTGRGKGTVDLPPGMR